MNALAFRLVPNPTARRWLAWIVPIAIVAVAVGVGPYSAPLGVIINGALVGGRIALIALGIALVYRANRVINFAAAELGLVPTVVAILLIITLDWPYVVAAVVGLLAAVLVALVVQSAIVRRFSKSPRLILTVATIGISQLLVFLAFQTPSWFESLTGKGFEQFGSTRIDPPFTYDWSIEGFFFNANDLLTIIAVPICFVALAWFLQRSNTGRAVRAAAEREDRAMTLGISVVRVQTIVWIVAGVLAYVALFLRAGVAGLPLNDPADPALGTVFLLQAITAVIIGRFEHFPTIAIAAIALGILDQANTFQAGNDPSFNNVMLFVILAVALLVTKPTILTRAGNVTTWQTSAEVRPIPAEMRRLPEVRAGIAGVALALVAFVLTLPLWLTEAQMNLAAVIVIFSIVGISLVVLTGWAGQVSLGQVGFMGIGAIVGGALTNRAGWDISLAMLVGGLAGAVVAVVIGYPAIRRRGLTLAVITYGFALVVGTYLVAREFFGDWLPDSRIERPKIFGVIDISTETRFYFFSLAVLLIVGVMVHGIRHSRTGRAVIAVRENESAARAYGIDTVRTTMVSFAISGFFAAVAGVLFVHQQEGLGTAVYAPRESLTTFAAVVIGGMTSVVGAVIGSVYVRGLKYFLPGNWQLLASSVGLLLVLWALPRGLGGSLAVARDNLLRKIATRRGMVVPSLLADERVDDPVGVDTHEVTAAMQSRPTREQLEDVF